MHLSGSWGLRSGKMSVEIKVVATAKEMGVVAGLAKTIWNEHYVPIIGQAQVDYMVEKYQTKEAIYGQIKNEGYQYFLVTVTGKPVGYIGIVEKNNELFLSKIYILGSERGKGLGRIGINYLVEKGKTDGLEFITLTVNKHNRSSIQAYEKMGFEKYGEVVSDIGSGYVMDDYLMRLRINIG